MNHETIAARVDAIAMITGILAGLAAAGAALATPTGFTALGIWLGLVDEPLIIKLAPTLDTVATVCGTISGFTFFYSKHKKRNQRPDSPSDSTVKKGNPNSETSSLD